MNYRFMRTILFFDLPTLTLKHKRSYRKFLKAIKAEGFIILQESVYAKLSISYAQSQLVKKRISDSLPDEGLVFALNITEKQFNDLEILVGENNTSILNDDERLVEL